METYIKKLLNIALFKGIPESELKCLLKCIGGYTKTFLKGRYILFEEESIKSIGIVLSGTVHMIKEDVWGNTTIIARISESELFGESFVCSDNHHSVVSF